jgi:hypothetical protein
LFSSLWSLLLVSLVVEDVDVGVEHLCGSSSWVHPFRLYYTHKDGYVNTIEGNRVSICCSFCCLTPWNRVLFCTQRYYSPEGDLPCYLQDLGVILVGHKGLEPLTTRLRVWWLYFSISPLRWTFDAASCSSPSFLLLICCLPEFRRAEPIFFAASSFLSSAMWT